VGRLQTDADRARVIEGLNSAGMRGAGDLAKTLKQLAARYFLMRDAHAGEGTIVLQPRWATSFNAGP
jgi:hypothetical protein